MNTDAVMPGSSPSSGPRPSPAQPFLLASILTAYPGEDFPGYIGMLFDNEALEPAALRAGEAAWEEVIQALEQSFGASEGLDALRSEYIDLFDRGASASPLYETEYGRDRAMRKAAELSDLAGFYRAFGFAVDEQRLHDMLDHLSVELEFYALMLMKESTLAARADAEGVEIVRDARRKFLREHLGRFPAAVAARPSVADSSFYGPVLRWCRHLLEAECRAEEVTPLPLEWISGQAEAEEVTCGAAGSGCSSGAGNLPV